MRAYLMCAEVVFMGQSDLFLVQWALSLVGGEHSPAQSPPLPLSRPRPAQPRGHIENTDAPLGLIDVPDKPHLHLAQPPLRASTPSI